MKIILTYSTKKILDRFNARYEELDERIFRRKLRDPEIFAVAETIRENLDRAAFGRLFCDAEELAGALAEIDRQLKILAAFVARNEERKGYRPEIRQKTRRESAPRELTIVFAGLLERKVEPSPVFSRPIRRR